MPKNKLLDVFKNDNFNKESFKKEAIDRGWNPARDKKVLDNLFIAMECIIKEQNEEKARKAKEALSLLIINGCLLTQRADPLDEFLDFHPAAQNYYHPQRETCYAELRKYSTDLLDIEEPNNESAPMPEADNFSIVPVPEVKDSGSGGGISAEDKNKKKIKANENIIIPNFEEGSAPPVEDLDAPAAFGTQSIKVEQPKEEADPVGQEVIDVMELLAANNNGKNNQNENVINDDPINEAPKQPAPKKKGIPSAAAVFFGARLCECDGILTNRWNFSHTDEHRALAAAFRTLKNVGDPDSAQYDYNAKKSALIDARNAAKAYIKAKLNYDNEDKPADWRPGSPAGRDRFNGALQLVINVTEEMKRLGMKVEKENEIFAEQCKVRKAFNPKKNISVKSKYSATNKCVNTILMDKLGSKPTKQVKELMIADKQNAEDVKRVADLAVAKKGGRVYGDYIEKAEIIQSNNPQAVPKTTVKKSGAKIVKDNLLKNG